MTIDPKDPVALTQALIRYPSVTPDDAGTLDFLQSILEPAGFKCKRKTFSQSGTYDVDNLYAQLVRGKPNLCFAGHTDVVPPGDEAQWHHPPFAGEIHDDILYGRGAVDMKGGIACFVSAALNVIADRDSDLPGSISLLITGDEEGEAINGTEKALKWLKEEGKNINACIVGEPTNPGVLGDEIKIGRRGSLTGELIVHGKQGHSAYPHKADNPIPKLARLIDQLSMTPFDDGSKFFEPTNCQVTILSVPNTASNVIPAHAKATFNIRYNDKWSRERLEAFVRETCQKAAAEIGAKFDIVFSGRGDVFVTKPGPLVETMSQAVQTVTGKTPALTTGGGTSDARFIKDYCPVIEFGLVNKTIHEVNEHVPVANLKTLSAIYKLFMERFFSQP